MKKIFISYSWAKNAEANIVDNILSLYEIEVIRDVRDLKQLENVRAFMDRINEADYAILLISDSYIKSKNCMYELLKLIENKDLKNKAVPVLLSDIKISSPIKRLEYLKYWETQISELQFGIQNNLSSFAFANNLIKDLEQFQLIRNKIDDFFTYINEHLYFIYEEQSSKSFSDVIETLKIKKKIINVQNEYNVKETIDRISLNPKASSIPIIDIYRLLLSISNNSTIGTSRLLGHLQEIIENICMYFNTVTKSTCSVSLKVFTNDQSVKSDTYVLTLIRDKKSSLRYSEIDKIKARIIDNTSYYSALANTITNKKSFFVSNDLSAESSYKNSYFEIYRNNFWGKKQWSLPYISSMTIPIYRNDDSKQVILGFLNIDSDKKKSFKNENDINIMQEIGGLLFYPLKQLRKSV